MQSDDLSLKIETKDESGLKITYINSQTKTGLLHTQIKNLVVPDGYELAKVNVFSSLDGTMALNIFSFESTNKQVKHATLSNATELLNYIQEVKAGKFANDHTAPVYNDLFSESSLSEYLNRVTPSYVENTQPRAFMAQRNLFEKVRGTDGTAVSMYPAENDGTWIAIAAANVLPEVLLRILSSITSARGLDITRAHLDSIACPETSTADMPSNVTMLRLLVNAAPGTPDLNHDAEFASAVARDLKRGKWLDNETTELGLYRHKHVGLHKAEVITAFCSMLHGPLYKVDPNTYASVKAILQLIDSKPYMAIAESIATLFLNRFNPADPLPNAEFVKKSDEIRSKIKGIQFDGPRRLLDKMLDGVQATLRTNFYNEDRYALSLRLHPSIMMPPNATADKPLPFGVFFIHGRNFNAFHNRFRDIARGGLRIVTPANAEQHALESTRTYDEVYGLSFAQQLKNKDIPEGGSKGVVLVNTVGMNPSTKFFAMRKSVRGFSDALLDLIVKDSVQHLVDFYGKDELIYLGPDEQIIPSDIEWIIERAGQRGYPIPAAFMSSKKDDGFNHKEFGVTSEGVVVYLDVALRNVLNIDPHTQPFSVKITGGPDGDVAGNLMNILFRDYPNTAKVVAVADGFGVAEDTDGLNAEELLRLFHEGKSIDHFRQEKLGPNGICLSATTEEGANRRNTMHFRVKSDVFVPAGGRPNTINGDNWRQFLDADGKPSSPLIVEGANIFNTPEARENLYKHAGVVIVKDSSANKCGVVTSSCEVAASMLLTKAEFMAIKPELVADVLVKLRNLARLEGELLLREYRNYPGALPHFSERISFAIAKATDAITDALADVHPEDPLFKELFPLVIENLPKKLATEGGERVLSRFPVQYMRNAIASTLASKLVYQEGIHLVEAQPYPKLAERAFAYFRADQRMKKIIGDLEHDSSLGEHKDVVIDILRRGGARSSLNIF